MYVKGLKFEEVRQANVLRNGGEILQETRRLMMHWSNHLNAC